jgi:hypothetical protein
MTGRYRELRASGGIDLRRTGASQNETPPKRGPYQCQYVYAADFAKGNSVQVVVLVVLGSLQCGLER